MIAAQTNTGIVHGPLRVPYHDLFGGSGGPTHPGEYGLYIAIDLTENNRCQIEQAHELHPDRPRPDFGWGVCRHGFGLQSFGDGYMTETVATARAHALNTGGMATDAPNRKED